MAVLARMLLLAWPFAPLLIVPAAIVMTARISRVRWMAHVLTLVALLVAGPVCIWLQGILDPTTIKYPGPGEGLGVLLYLFNLVPATLIYSGYAWLTRRTTRDVQLRSAEQG